MENIISALSFYYGLDWLSMVFGFYGNWLLTNKNAFGFFFIMCSMLAAIVVAVMAAQYGFIAANIINMAIALRGLILWTRKEENPVVA